MKKYILIIVLAPLFICAGGDGLKSESLTANKKYTQQEDASAKEKAAEVTKNQPAQEKQSKSGLLAIFKCCCCGKVEKD